MPKIAPLQQPIPVVDLFADELPTPAQPATSEPLNGEAALRKALELREQTLDLSAYPRDNVQCDGEVVDIASLVPDTLNAVEHSEENIAGIMQSLALYGQRKPVVVRAQDRMIAAGNGTVDAAKRLGWTRVAASVRPMTDVEFYGYAIADNRTGDMHKWNLENTAKIDKFLSEHGGTMVGWSSADLKAMRLRVTPRLAVSIEPVENPITITGDVWVLGRHRLMCGDSTNADDVARLLNGARPELMVTDPPYGVDYDPNWRQEQAVKGLLAYACRRVGEVLNDTRVDWRAAWSLAPCNVVYCWHAGVYTAEVQLSLEQADFEPRAHIVWVKSNFPISRGHYHWRHEPCWYAVRKGTTAKWIGDRKQTTVWEINLDKNVDGGHSTQKPLECMARGIRNHEGDVYDPFVGSGTTLIAADDLDRVCYAMEISPAYCDAAIMRWITRTGGDPVRERDGAKWSELKAATPPANGSPNGAVHDAFSD